MSDRIRQPKQERSQETMIRILDAFEEALRRGPYDLMTINDIAREANTGAGSIYARFRDKRSILLAVQDRFRLRAKFYFEELYDSKLWADPSISEAMNRIVRGNLEWFRKHRHIVKAGLLLDDTDILQATANAIRPTNMALSLLLQHHFPSLPGGDAINAATKILILMIAVFQQMMIFGEVAPTGRDMPDDALIDMLVMAAVAQLSTASSLHR